MNAAFILKYFFLYTLIIFGINFFFDQLSYYEELSCCLFIHVLYLVIIRSGSFFPIRYLFITLMILEILIGPLFQYHIPFLDNLPNSYKMSVSSDSYYKYVLPAVLCFIAGIFYRVKNNEGENIDKDIIQIWIAKEKNLPYVLIASGFVSSVMEPFVPSSFTFVFYLLSGLKFIGVFILVFSKKNIWFMLVFVYGFELMISLKTGMFHDLLIWLFFLAFALSIRYAFILRTKFIGLVVFISLGLTIQVIKADYRKEIAINTGKSSLIAAADIASSKIKHSDDSEEKTVEVVNRLNQGWIIARVMQRVPAYEPYANGKTIYKYLESAILPRIIAPNKLVAGDHTIFDRYTGLGLTGSRTSMALSSLGDGYANFGLVGGCIFMFFYGLAFNSYLKYIGKLSETIPSISVFMPLIFAYPVRPDCDTQTILGHFIKSSILLIGIYFFFKNRLQINLIEETEAYGY